MQLSLEIHIPDFITRLFSSALWRYNIDEKVCYLTFDDGPVPEVTPWVLDFLDEKGIKATFFVVGENVSRYPDLYQDILDRGHSVGNHTYHHLQGVKVSKSRYLEDIDRAATLVKSSLFRPPHGLVRGSQYRALKGSFQIVMWDIVSCDYNRKLTAERVVSNVLRYIRPGSIITFHDSIKSEKNLKGALPEVVNILEDRGYRFEIINNSKNS